MASKVIKPPFLFFRKSSTFSEQRRMASKVIKPEPNLNKTIGTFGEQRLMASKVIKLFHDTLLIFNKVR